MLVSIYVHILHGQLLKHSPPKLRILSLQCYNVTIHCSLFNEMVCSCQLLRNFPNVSTLFENPCFQQVSDPDKRATSHLIILKFKSELFVTPGHSSQRQNGEGSQNPKNWRKSLIVPHWHNATGTNLSTSHVHADPWQRRFATAAGPACWRQRG